SDNSVWGDIEEVSRKMRGIQAESPLCSVQRASHAGIALVLLVCLPLFGTSSARAETAIRFSGELGGLVTDAAGKRQPGAIVLLFNRQDRLLQRSATNGLG